jgi:hypothetical protein
MVAYILGHSGKRYDNVGRLFVVQSGGERRMVTENTFWCRCFGYITQWLSGTTVFRQSPET